MLRLHVLTGFQFFPMELGKAQVSKFQVLNQQIPSACCLTIFPLSEKYLSLVLWEFLQPRFCDAPYLFCSCSSSSKFVAEQSRALAQTARLLEDIISIR
jgi:hypothetical protein